jgi:hypothetical protein
MARMAVAVLALVLAAAPAFADVTVKYTMSGKGMMGMAGTVNSTTMIKGNKMRSEAMVGNTQSVSIIDLDKQQMITLDLKKKEAEVLDLAKFNAELADKVGASNAQVSIKPSGETKELLGQSCKGYTVSISMPMTMGEGMSMTMSMGGPMFLAIGAPGSNDFAAFYRAAAEKGFFFTDPKQAKAQPAQAKSMAEMYKAVADLKGVMYEQVMDIKIQGEGPMAAMMSKMGSQSMTMTATSVATDALSDDLFGIPAGFKVKNAK